MNILMVKQNAEILLEVAQNYETLLEKRKIAPKDQMKTYDVQLKNFRNQFLYLLASINKYIEQEKNAG